MSDSRVAGGLDRLPWLTDEPVRRQAPPPARRRGWDWMGWGVSTVLVVAGLSFWLGTRAETGDRQPALPPPSATVPVPAPRAAPTEQVRVMRAPEVAQTREPEVRVIRVPEVRIVTAPAPKAAKDSARTSESAKVEETAKSAPVAVSAPVAPPVAAPLRPWSPRVVAGASGRLVQIGAYGSRLQAKQGWVKMSRAYPALKRLPAVVAVTRNSRGRLFYRFQIGTTSQAHSEILCQRMQRIDLSCAVVGLPWKAKVER